jgi:hypothetical protein
MLGYLKGARHHESRAVEQGVAQTEGLPMHSRVEMPLVLRSLVAFSWAAFVAAVGAIVVAFVGDLVVRPGGWRVADAFVENYTVQCGWIPYLYMAFALPAVIRGGRPSRAASRAMAVRLARALLLLAIAFTSVGFALGGWDWSAVTRSSGALLRVLWSWGVPSVWLLLLRGPSVRRWAVDYDPQEANGETAVGNA